MKELLDKIRRLPQVNEPQEGGQAWYHEGVKLAIVRIPKCGSLAIKAGVEGLPGVDAAPLERRPGMKYVAMLRDPVERWASGFSTWLTLQVNHEKIKSYEALVMLDDIDCKEYIFDTICFDGHTSPQSSIMTPLSPILGNVELFPVTRRAEFYEWVAKRGFLVTPHEMHGTASDPEGVHFKLYCRTMRLLDTPSYRKKIEKYYHTDRILYTEALCRPREA